MSILLLDDHQARRAAAALHLAVVGTAGLLVQAKRAALIDEVLPLLLAMKSQGYYISERIVEYVGQVTGETHSLQ